MTRAIVISIDGLAAFYWDDPAASLPALRALGERGVVARRMDTVFPSTTWPTHVSLVTGVSPARHGVVGNSILNRATARPEDLTGDPVYDAPDLLRAPTVYDHARAAGLRTAAIDWPATRNCASIDFCLPFFKDQTVFETRTPRAVWTELAALGYPLDRQGEWAQLPKRFLKDAMVADLAAHVVRRHTPDLLLLHFLCVDSFQHLHGPRSPEAYWAMAYVDGLIGRFLATFPAGELTDRTSVFVVSDHGFLPVTRDIRLNVRLRQLGALRVDAAGRVTGGEARFVANLGAGYLYALGDANRERLSDLAAELAGLEGVARVWTEAGYAALGLPTPAENAHVGDLLFEAAAGYCFVDDAQGDEVAGPPRYRGTHGQRATHPDIGAFFLAAGPGIVRGQRLGEIRSRDVAPTLAHVLGLKIAPTEGRALGEIFTA
ncbi:MAG TPA: ectonucleotide pyrophosphatase/phosphodiesterase [Methylomirabilota bacterium]|nr:ectonucleotide pyrophosphatase/phosphodiesterase [Methylomirabilota bacterium]